MIPLGTIVIRNNVSSVEIDIEGIIGVPEKWQFDEPGDRVSTYDKFREIIAQIKEIKAQDIIVNIRSTGGNVNDALLIFDSISALPAMITTQCFGYVASAATIIAQAGSQGKRLISENSLYLIHKGNVFADGNENDLEATIDLLRKTDERIANIYATRSGKDLQSFVDLMSENNGNGRWMSPDEVINTGLADSMVKVASPSNVSLESVKMLNLPDIPKEKQLITNSTTMKVNNAWAFILNFFGFDKEKDNELTEDQVAKLNDELAIKQDEVTNLTNKVTQLAGANEMASTEYTSSLSGKETDITNLKNKISELEGQLAQKNAPPTKTEDREDPPVQELLKNVREESYTKDIKNFK